MADLHVQIDPSTYFLRSHQAFVSAAHKCTQRGLTNAAAFSTICIKSSVFGLFRDWSTIIISSVFELAAAAAAAVTDQHVAGVNS